MPTETMRRPETVDLDLGRGLLALLTRRDRKFLKWAKAVNLDAVLEPLKVKLREGANGK